jgi:hypothetical protein
MAMLSQSLEDYKMFEQKMNPEWPLWASVGSWLSIRSFEPLESPTIAGNHPMQPLNGERIGTRHS